MPFVMGVCPECKKILPVDDGQKTWICGYCEAKFPVSLAVSKFNESGKNYDNVADSIEPVSRKSDFVIVCGVVKEYRGESRNIVIPEGVVGIDSGIFKYMPVKSIVIPKSMTNIGYKVFEHCALKSLAIPESVTSIGTYAFEYCVSLESITIPKSVRFIDNWAFSYCESLKYVRVPKSTNISNYAFEYCSEDLKIEYY